MRDASARPDKRVYAAFVLLALLAGPVADYASNAMLGASNGQLHAGMALAALVAGAAMTCVALVRRERLPKLGDWGVLLFLLAPQWGWAAFAALTGTVPWLHGLGDGAVLLIGIAAPLWLALLAALEVASIEVPVACVVSAIAGIFALLLVLPANTCRLSWAQVPMLAVAIGLGILTAFSWVIARRRFRSAPIAGLAAACLLLSAAGEAVFSLLKERATWQPLDWHSLMVPVAGEAALLVASWCLWFWLLQRITLGAFGMRALAAWAATALPVFVTVGVLQWRVDAAFAISVTAVVVGLRARQSDEQPTALGLREF